MGHRGLRLMQKLAGALCSALADGGVAFGDDDADEGEDDGEDGRGYGLRRMMSKEAGDGGDGPADG